MMRRFVDSIHQIYREDPWRRHMQNIRRAMHHRAILPNSGHVGGHQIITNRQGRPQRSRRAIALFMLRSHVRIRHNPEDIRFIGRTSCGAKRKPGHCEAKIPNRMSCRSSILAPHPMPCREPSRHRQWKATHRRGLHTHYRHHRPN